MTMMTDSSLPTPLVPPDVDLRGFAFMPLEVDRLRDSELAAVPNGEVFRVNVLSWCLAWRQVPAGSLPDDDAWLARMLGWGRDVKTWQRIRAEGGLRHWIKCSDGRLYHPVVAEHALDAWQRKQAYRDRTQNARAARQRQRLSQSEVGSVTDQTGTETKTGTGTNRNPNPSGSAIAHDAEAAVSAWNELAQRHGLAQVQKLSATRAKKLRQRLADCGGLDGWRAALEKIPNIAWLRGNNERGWRADFDFVLQEKSFIRLMEGSYDSSPTSNLNRNDLMRAADQLAGVNELNG